ncbi:hypothetical protein [Streptomyces sp. NPDC050145]|uniref:hypothetical protein n=1 Tax=Streptomyces sp. NPDC050145 TaxID=3365602 RepID=UPI0037B3DC48
MLRSVVIAAFSAGLAASVASGLDLGWNASPASTVAATPPDLGWNSSPTTTEGSSVAPPDLGWNVAPQDLGWNGPGA